MKQKEKRKIKNAQEKEKIKYDQAIDLRELELIIFPKEELQITE